MAMHGNKFLFWAKLNLGVALLDVALKWASLAFVLPGTVISPMAFAPAWAAYAVLRMGWGVLPGVVLGAAAGGWLGGDRAWALVLSVLVQVLQSWVVRASFKRSGGLQLSNVRGVGVLALVLAVVGMVPLVGGLLEQLVQTQGFALAWSDIMLTEWLSHTAGMALLMPLLWSFGQARPHGVRVARQRWEWGAMMLGALAASMLFFFHDWPSWLRPTELVLGLFLLWAGQRFGLRSVSLMTLLVSLVAISGITMQAGRLPAQVVHGQLLSSQWSIALLGLMGLTIHAAFSMRRQSENALRALSSELEAEVVERTQELESINHRLQQDVADREASASNLRLYRQIFDYSQDAVLVLHLDGRVLQQNPAHRALFGYMDADLVETPALGKLLGDSAASFVLEMLQSQGQYRGQLWGTTRSQETLELDVAVFAVRGENRLPTFYVAVLRDVTQQNRLQHELLTTEMRYRALVEQSSEGIFTFDPGNLMILDANPTFLKLMGYSLKPLQAKKLTDIMDADEASVVQGVRQVLLYGQHMVGERRYRRQDGQLIDVELSASLIKYNQERVVMVSVRDISERKRSEARLKHMAEHDGLTSLPNRMSLANRIREAIRKGQQSSHTFAVLFIDLDRFKTINDSLGHSVGDELLIAVAERLQNLIQTGDTVSRLGGDEFVMLLCSLSTHDQVAAFAERVLHQLSQRYLIANYELVVTPSIGISVYPQDGVEPDLLLRHADAAMYHAKEQGRSNFQFFHSSMNERAQERLLLESQLRLALDRGEFLLCYQPQVSLLDGHLVGFEALVRWQHPELGLVPPAKFIPVAEDTGMIERMGHWVLREACRQNRAWQNKGLKVVPIAVNLSAWQLHQGHLVGQVQQALHEFELDAHLLELEVTEGAILRNVDQVLVTMQTLKDMGVRLSVDDFGTGYSSLAYLKQFAIDKLKVDQSFVREVAYDKDDAAITLAIIHLAKSLGLGVIAEGVETEAQIAFLREHGCDEAQGYFYGVPLDPMTAEQRLRVGF